MKEIQAPPQLPGWVSTSEDQVRFARWSGDSNPMHLDGRVARRMPGGLPVVHGLHTVLKCFEALASLPERPDHVRGVKVRFLRPVLVGDRVDLRVIGGRSDELQVQADVDGLTVAVLKLAVGVPADAPAGQVGEATQGGTTGGDGPREIRMDEMIGRAGVVPFSAPAQTFAEAFPQAASWLGADRLRGLACLSRLVGMECPGLHSLLVGLSVEFVVTGASSAPLAYSVQTVDDRFRRVQIKVTGAGLNGVVDAAVRMPPTRQASMTEIGGRVDAKAFSGQVALIVGGSRGLGEVAVIRSLRLPWAPGRHRRLPPRFVPLVAAAMSFATTCTRRLNRNCAALVRRRAPSITLQPRQSSGASRVSSSPTSSGNS
jgi:hypothetical protein